MLAKISMSLSVLLAIAVGYLLYKTSSNDNAIASVPEDIKVAEAFSGEEGVKSTVVAFINGDSLNQKYEFITEKGKDLEQKMNAAELRVKEAFGSRQQRFDSNMRYAQEHPNMPESEAMALQQEMEKLQAEMDGIQEREVGVLKRKEEEMHEELMSRVNKYLEAYSKQRGIDYVINKQSEFRVILYGNSAYDVTDEVIAGLNAEYRAEKEKK